MRGAARPRTGMRTSFQRTLVLIPIIMSIVVIVAVDAELRLKQLHVITRHGSRYPLTKNANTLSEGTEGTLTPLGQKQLYDLGLWLRQLYSAFSVFDTYIPSKVRLESSSFERTVSSANALALGLFPPATRDPTGESMLPVSPANVPVYTTEVKNDVTIRAYDKCETFLTRLDDLYASQKWQNLEQGNAELLTRLANIPAFQVYADRFEKVPLAELWNVFDAIHVAQTECNGGGQLAPSPTCLNLPDPSIVDVLNDEDWTNVQKLSHRAELLKYGTETAGRLVGGNLMLQILGRMQGEDVGLASADFEKFYLYSGHYPSILAVFAALNNAPIESEVIPSYASALIFEVYLDDVLGGARLVRILYKSGDDNEQKPVILDNICTIGEATYCNLKTMTSFFSNLSLEGWCQDCENDGADVCLKTLVESKGSCSSSDLEIPVAVGWFTGILTSLIIFIATCLVQKQRQRSVCSSKMEERTEALSVEGAIIA